MKSTLQIKIKIIISGHQNPKEVIKEYPVFFKAMSFKKNDLFVLKMWDKIYTGLMIQNLTPYMVHMSTYMSKYAAQSLLM